MITIHGKCNMCGRLDAAVEVEIPHATIEHRKAKGISATGILCAAICRTCIRAGVAAWAAHGAVEWARMKAELEAAKAAKAEEE